MANRKFSYAERIIHKIKGLFEPYLAPIRRKRLNNTDFTIISNNCWGGRVYEYFGLKKNSPTVGLYIYAEDYIKFITNLRYYLGLELHMIRPEEANHVNDLEMDGHMDVPIGKLDDVEIVFLHYKNPEIAKATWDRRVERVNWDNIIIKNSYMCRCNDQCVIEFQKIRGYKKFMFVPIGYNGSDDKTDLIEIPSRINSTTDLGDDVFDLNKYINLTELINM